MLVQLRLHRSQFYVRRVFLFNRLNHPQAGPASGPTSNESPSLVPEAIQPSSIVIIIIIIIISTITRSTIRFSSKGVLAGTVPMYIHTRHPIFAITTEKTPSCRLYK